jgi:hypothetical protein
MTGTITGVVEVVETRQTKIGPMFNLKVNGQSYGYGKFAPKCKAGDTVTFGVIYNGQYANVDTKNIQVTPGTGAPPPAAAAPRAQNSSGSMGKDDYWERKEAKDEARQTIISKQSALNSALQFVAIMATQGLIPAGTKAKDGTSILEGVVEHYRDVFYKTATGESMPTPKGPAGAPDAAGVDDEEEEVTW